MFIRPSGHHIASWRHPEGHADAGENFARMIEIAQTAERGLLDMVFCAVGTNDDPRVRDTICASCRGVDVL